MHKRGAFGVARFDWQGNAKAFTLWNERQAGSTLFCIWSTIIIKMAVGASSHVKT